MVSITTAPCVERSCERGDGAIATSTDDACCFSLGSPPATADRLRPRLSHADALRSRQGISCCYYFDSRKKAKMNFDFGRTISMLRDTGLSRSMRRFHKSCSVLQPIMTPGRVAVRVRSAEVDSNRLNPDYKLRSFSCLEW